MERASLLMTEEAIESNGQPLTAGDRLGDFEIVGSLGRGGMGVVFEACQLSLGQRRVALKVLRTELADEESKRRFRREVRLLATLHHENLAEVYGFGEERGRLFYAMQLVEGPTLHDVILEQRAAALPINDTERIRRCVRWVNDVAAALALVHDQGLVHRDVKPANIVLDAAGLDRAILVDFGLVRAVEVDSVVLTVEPAATLAFAPTEQILGRRPGPASDVFALGVTLHDLLTSRLPRDRHQASLGLESLEELLPGIDPDLAAAVGKATDPMAQWRYAHAGELRSDLEAWLEGRPVSARRPPRLERLERWVRANPARIARAMLGLLCATLVVVGVSTTWGWIRAGHAATRAEAASDLVELARQARSIPAPLQPVLIRGDAGDLARRLRQRAAHDPLIAVADDLERGDPSAALLESVTALRVDGLEAHPVLTRLVERQVREASTPRPAEVPHDNPQVFQLVARLFYERPDTSPAAQVASGPIRDALLTCLEVLPTERARDRGYLLTALSGCGRAEDVDTLIPAVRLADARVEDQRLATRCIERIVRRAHRCGGLTAPRVRAWIRALGPTLASRRHASGAYYWRAHAARAAIDALGAAACAVDCRSEIAGLLGDEPVTAEDADNLLMTLAQWGDESVLAGVERGLSDLHRPRTWGMLLPMLASSDLARRIEGQVRSTLPEPSAALAEFELGLRTGRARARGIVDTLLPDEESLLGYAGRSTETHVLPLESAGVEHAGALWRLTTAVPGRAGMATGLSYRNATHHVVPLEVTATSFLRLWAFGESVVQLHFDIDAPLAGGAWALKLTHVAAARAYYPGLGEVYLEVFLDDQPIGEILLPHVQGGSWATQSTTSLVAPVQSLGLGVHQLELRVSKRTTTTYRLVQAELVLEAEDSK